MGQLIDKSILVVITMTPDRVNGAVPIFEANSLEEIQEKAHLFENLLGAMTHKVDENTYVLVRH